MYRQKKYECGNYMDIEVFSLPEKVKPFKRAKKVKETTPSQKNLNDKKSLRFFVRKANLNFPEGYSEELTYDEKYLPQSEEEVHNDLKNYFERVRYWNRKLGLPNPEYMYVISEVDKDGNKTRYHVHMFIKNIDRDLAEKLWTKGRANTDRLQPDEYGVTGKALYFARQGKGKKAWGCSKGLKQPEPEVSDKFIQRKEFERIERNPEDRQYFEKLYPGWTFSDCTIEEDDSNGRRLYIRLRKYEPIWKTQNSKKKKNLSHKALL
jgi:hypothetical protein